MLAAHKAWLSNTIYAPKFPWKKGERDAFKTTSREVNDSTTPIYTIPPAGDFDHEAGRVITPAEHVRLFGTRLWESRKDRPVFIDANYLDDDRHRVAFNVHPLTALLERSRLVGAQAWPVTSYGRSDLYQEAVAKAHLLHGSPIAMQISLSDLGASSLGPRLKSLCSQVSCDPQDAVLLIDAGSLHFGDEQQETAFTNILVSVLNELPQLYDWNQIIFSATSLSDPQKIIVGEQKFIRRSELNIYRKLVSRKSELNRLPIFSDHGVEFTSNLAPRKARPSAKISYTTDAGHFYAKGANVKNGGYEAIYPVAKAVAESSYFKGANFSRGDAKILLLSQEVGGTGNAPIWKWAAVDHHLAMVGMQLAIELDRKLPVLEGLDNDNFGQGNLLSLIPAK